MASKYTLTRANICIEIPDHPRVLALDGGGIRGLSSLLILQNIMDEVGAKSKDPDPKPCKYFDLIGGTSAGGLIAIMLGRLGMVNFMDKRI